MKKLLTLRYQVFFRTAGKDDEFLGQRNDVRLAQTLAAGQAEGLKKMNRHGIVYVKDTRDNSIVGEPIRL